MFISTKFVKNWGNSYGQITLCSILFLPLSLFQIIIGIETIFFSYWRYKVLIFFKFLLILLNRLVSFYPLTINFSSILFCSPFLNLWSPFHPVLTSPPLSTFLLPFPSSQVQVWQSREVKRLRIYLAHSFTLKSVLVRKWRQKREVASHVHTQEFSLLSIPLYSRIPHQWIVSLK